MSDTLLASLVSTLDTVVFERLPNSVFMQVTPSPRWFAQVFGAESQGLPITLSQAFPFLETFLADAEQFWLARRPEVLRSEPFTARAPDDTPDLLLRAAAVIVAHRPLLIVERLVGVADPREFLQTARRKDLDHERLRKQWSSLPPALDALHRAIDELAAAHDTSDRAALDWVRAAASRLAQLASDR